MPSSSPLNHFKRLLTRGSRFITAGAMAVSLTDFLGQLGVWENECGPTPSGLASEPLETSVDLLSSSDSFAGWVSAQI